VDKCPSRDDGWGEFVEGRVPVAIVIRTQHRLFRFILLIPSWESPSVDLEKKREPARDIKHWKR
jgi:hypothetical protein